MLIQWALPAWVRIPSSSIFFEPAASPSDHVTLPREHTQDLRMPESGDSALKTARQLNHYRHLDVCHKCTLPAWPRNGFERSVLTSYYPTTILSNYITDVVQKSTYPRCLQPSLRHQLPTVISAHVCMISIARWQQCNARLTLRARASILYTCSEPTSSQQADHV